MDDEIDLRDIFRVLWKNRLLISGIFLIAVVVAGVASFAMPSVYRVSSIIAPGNFYDPIYTRQDIVTSMMLSDEFLREVFEQIHPNATERTLGEFKETVKVVPVKNSDELIEISVETPEKQEGKMAVEKMIWLYAKRSENSYQQNKNVLSNELNATKERLDVLEMGLNLTLETLTDMQDSSDPSSMQTELRFSRALDYLSGMETQHSALIDRSLDLQKQLMILRHVDVVQMVREPDSPIAPRRTLIMAIAGIVGLMIGIFAAFLRESLESSTEQSDW